MTATLAQKRKRIPPHYSFNFAPVCMLHLRNLHKTFQSAVAAKSGDYLFQDYAKVALPKLEEMINSGKFANLPELPNGH